MKAKFCSILSALALLAGVNYTLAQNPVITSFSQNGVLVCSNLNAGSLAAVQWASSPTGPWKTDWTSLNPIPAGPNNGIVVHVPMFYRVLGITGTNTTPPGMAFIPAGSYTIGDTLGEAFGDDYPTNVFVSAFYMDKTLVSSELWSSVLTYALANDYVFAEEGEAKGSNYPVDSMTWYDSVAWCNARSQQAGLTPVYYVDSSFTYIYTNVYNPSTGWGTSVYANWSANGFRLPTEAEWEKAARGGVSGQRFPWGNTISYAQANYASSSGTQLQNRTYDLATGGNQFETGAQPYDNPVTYFAPNAYGLYDMSGNLREWCWDWYAAPPYPIGSPYLGGASDPHGPASGGFRVARGGGYYDWPQWCSCPYRLSLNPEAIGNEDGFRCVRGL